MVLPRSRIEWTQRLVQSFEQFEQPLAVLVQASASGYHANQGDLELTRGRIPWRRPCPPPLCRLGAGRVGGGSLGTADGVPAPRRGARRRPAVAGLAAPGERGAARQSGTVRYPGKRCIQCLRAIAGSAQRVCADSLAGVLPQPHLLRIPALPALLLLGERATRVLASQRMAPQRLTPAQLACRHSELLAALCDLLHPP